LSAVRHAADPDGTTPGAHVIFIGYRGSGKSAVGQRLAERLRRPFVDTDQFIEERCGRSIGEIFADEGEPSFRNREHHALAQLVRSPAPHVISVGGGAVLRADNRAILMRAGTCVWLTADAETLIARLQADPGTPTRRPALTRADMADEVRRLLPERVPFYESLAAIRIDTSGLTIEQVVEAVAQQLEAGEGH
jgi:shikimate kinase